MSATNPKRAIVPLPDNLTPQYTTCFCFEVPCDGQHLAAFWGALDALSKRYFWGKPLTADSEIVAEYWRCLLERNRASFDEEFLP